MGGGITEQIRRILNCKLDDRKWIVAKMKPKLNLTAAKIQCAIEFRLENPNEFN